MKFLDEKIMKTLSFSDFDVEKIELSPKGKELKIFVEGAWLDVDRDSPLGKGILYFKDWVHFQLANSILIQKNGQMLIKLQLNH